MVSSKAYLKKLNQHVGSNKPVHQMFDAVSKAIIKNVDSLITLDAPLPVSQLSRYLVAVCMAGVHSSTGTEQRDWIRLINMMLRTEISARAMDKDDKEFTEAQVEQVQNILEAAKNYQRFTDAQYEAVESDNGGSRPETGKEDGTGKGA